jgi:hypothetical protein
MISECICPSQSNVSLDDVVRARLKTMGVSDYSFVIDQGAATAACKFSWERAKFCIGPRGTFLWRIFDVGGVRIVGHA